MDSFVRTTSAASAGFGSAASSLLMPVEALTRGFDLAPDMASVASADSAVLAQLQSLQLQQMQALSAAAAPVGGVSSALTPVPSPAPVPGGVAATGDAGIANLFTETIGEQRQGFVVGGVGLMIGYEEGSELTELPSLYYLPNAPAWCMGLANLHGNMVPVFDLAAYLGLGDLLPADDAGASSRNMTARRMLLVLAHGPDAAGVVIDGLPERLYVSGQQQMQPDVAPDLLLPHVRSAVLIDGRLWFDLHTASLLDALEYGMQSS
ncbi:MAG: chemotaxis protein CheW [Brachymonas sp.]|nr:chemotaxis protein CheW [Brachymonas sp.]